MYTQDFDFNLDGVDCKVHDETIILLSSIMIYMRMSFSLKRFILE